MHRMSRLVFATLLVMSTTGCALSSSGPAKAFNEPSINRRDVNIRRIAVVPNRLPQNLNDPEFWRRRNFDEIRSQFLQRGYSVLDYETSFRAFEESGLPVDDTKSSRDKFAELATALGVDAIFVPYYGTSMEAGSSGLGGARYAYHATATYQVYHAASNQFVTRLDTEGMDGYRTGGMAWTLFSVVGLIAGPDGAALGLLAIIGPIIDGVQGMGGATPRWEQAFDRAIAEAVNAFAIQFPRGSAAPAASRR